MKRFIRLLVATLALASVLPVFAQASITVRLATVAPTNSIWHDALRSLGESWKKVADGRVSLQIFPGSVRGTESSYIKLMGIDDIQAALLLPPGLSEIDDAFNVLGMPFFFRTDEEAQAVLDKLTPALSKRLEAKRFHLVNWGSAGWVQIFSKRPVKSLDDIRKGQLYTTEGNDAMVRWYVANGFRPVAKSLNDIPAALKSPTGGIDIVPAPPLAAATMFFRDAPNMLDVKVAPLICAIVMNDRTWNRMPAADREKILQAAASFQKTVWSQASAIDAKEIAAMKQRALTVTTLDAKADAEFRAAADRMVSSMRGSMVPVEIFDLAVEARDEYRKAKKTAAN